MNMNGEQILTADIDAVWQALNDEAVLQASIPGCETLTRTSPTGFTAKVAVKIGPVKARFSGEVELSDFDPPSGYRIAGKGSGGIAGFAQGGAVVRLSRLESGTLLAYSVEAQVGGKLAQLGARLIDATAKKLAAEFFDNFGARLKTGDGASAAAGLPAGK